MSHLESSNAALTSENARLRGLLAQSRADNGHLRAKLACRMEREWAGEKRVLSAITGPDEHSTDVTGFSDGWT